MKEAKIVPFSDLRDADLMIDAVYEGGDTEERWG